ncbi:Retron-type RNA-directed DNA polymerase [Cardinium endosymbiont of Sogatella furcifera]|uniref:hypothetical protein n=1 Tax=Cardinium endosymbiont of Sogatella furcifera TaxID=650378 RepID=UPI000E0CE4A0|nr:hypothetical protein [Cardinium endosymbiont of Sogatella furcifera]AXI24032.1 Retron-type RNA-directed DNA polymerase [Cardinium endosymbiont of Sogatella furcifera]
MEELVTVEGKTFAQSALEKVRVLQNKLHQAAKKDQKRTFDRVIPVPYKSSSINLSRNPVYDVYNYFYYHHKVDGNYQ